MKLTITLEDGQTITATTEHSASSYGLPVVLVDGELTDLQCTYEPDADEGGEGAEA
jgi:hypothetical protein